MITISRFLKFLLYHLLGIMYSHQHVLLLCLVRVTVLSSVTVVTCVARRVGLPSGLQQRPPPWVCRAEASLACALFYAASVWEWSVFLLSLSAGSSRVLCGMVRLYRQGSVAHTSLSIDQLDTYRYCYSLPPWCLGRVEVWSVRLGARLMLARWQTTFKKEDEPILSMTLSSTDSNIYFK